MLIKKITQPELEIKMQKLNNNNINVLNELILLQQEAIDFGFN